jgi:enoyl-CoA hydratase
MSEVSFTRHGDIAVAVIEHPPVNALSQGVRAGLMAALERTAADPELYALVIRGGGNNFSAGADVREFGRPFEPPHLGEVIARAEGSSKAVIAALHGNALGGGLELALACDLIVASEKARFGQPEINLGLIPGFGGTQRLPHRIGHNKARELIMTGEMFDAATALQLGLANQVVAPAELMETTRKLAEKIANKSAVAIRQAKAALRASFTMNEDAGLRFEQEAFGVTFGSADRVEGTSAFVEKRPPKWQHK